MEVVAERRNDILSVVVSDRIDGSNAVAFEEAVRAAMEDGDRAMVMDLAELSYISSAGLRVLLSLAKDFSIRGGELVLCSLSDRIREFVEISGFDRIIPVRATRADALASLDA